MDSCTGLPDALVGDLEAAEALACHSVEKLRGNACAAVPRGRRRTAACAAAAWPAQGPSVGGSGSCGGAASAPRAPARSSLASVALMGEYTLPPTDDLPSPADSDIAEAESLDSRLQDGEPELMAVELTAAELAKERSDSRLAAVVLAQLAASQLGLGPEGLLTPAAFSTLGRFFFWRPSLLRPSGLLFAAPIAL
mmetsp:Transcript_19679/g.55457  ORF Transcript_19679/g.55457 Transcript_19679/m.55457 type:complete len:195 (+) Transcript_19679:1439-2023(+)